MLLHLVVAAALVAPGPAGRPTNSEAPADRATSWDRADALAAAGQHGQAVLEYSRAWDELRAAPILYSWAQSERLRGGCAQAIALYERFLEHGAEPPASYDSQSLRAHWTSMRDNADRQVETCREQARREADPQPLATTPSTTGTPPPPVVKPVDTLPRTTPRRAAPRPWWKDAAGWSLVASGMAVLVTGATLVGVAAAQSNDAERRNTHEEFRAAIDRAVLEQRIGFAALALGGALVLGGGVRWAVVARRHRTASRSVQLGVRGFGLGVHGRF